MKVTVLSMDIAGFSKLLPPAQKECIEKLYARLEQIDALKTRHSDKTLRHLHTGDGMYLLLRETCTFSDTDAITIAKSLLAESLGFQLRLGIDRGEVLETTLGTLFEGNFCGNPLNFAQRAMDHAADGQLACTIDYVNGLPDGLPDDLKPSRVFPVQFQAEVKHGVLLELHLSHVPFGQVPASDKEVPLSPKLASQDWKIAKNEDRGSIDFYAFDVERRREDRSIMHKQLVRKSFEPIALGEFDGLIRNGSQFRELGLDIFPVCTTRTKERPDTSISGPGLDYGDLRYGKYEARFYFSVPDGLDGLTLQLDVRYSRTKDEEATRFFQSWDLNAEVTESRIVDSELQQLNNEAGWIEYPVQFAYEGQAFVQFRLILLSQDLPEGAVLPMIIFYKVKLRRAGDLSYQTRHDRN